MQGLLDAILNQGGVCSILKLSCFIQYASRLKNEILLAQKSSHLPNIVPQFLPVSVVKFLASSCILSEQEVEECWKVVKELVWSAYILDDKAMSVAFKDHGTDKGFSSSTLASILVKQNNYISNITIQFRLVIFGLPHNSAPILIVNARIMEENSRLQPNERESSIRSMKGPFQFIPAF
jgi:hypothetical protein